MLQQAQIYKWLIIKIMQIFLITPANLEISEANITLNNNTAIENTYISKSNGGVQIEMRAVWVSQNGQIYVILCGSSFK